MIKKFYYSHFVKIIYNGNGATSGEVPIDDSSYLINSSIWIEDNIGNLLKTNYTFNGWNTKSDGSGINYFPGSWAVINDDDLVLYAQWKYEGNVLIRFPLGRDIIGCMYSEDPSSPQGVTYTGCGGALYSIGLIIDGRVHSPRRQMGPGGGGGESGGSVTTGEPCTFAVYEGTLQSLCGVKLKGISISCILNGALLSMQGTRTYTMPLGTSSSSVTCSYYDFTVPYENATIYICPIYESAS